MRGGPTKQKYKIPKEPGVEYRQVVMVGSEKYVFDTKEESDAFVFFLKKGVRLELALEEVKRLKEAGELIKDEPDTVADGGFGGFK